MAVQVTTCRGRGILCRPHYRPHMLFILLLPIVTHTVHKIQPQVIKNDMITLYSHSDIIIPVTETRWPKNSMSRINKTHLDGLNFQAYFVVLRSVICLKYCNLWKRVSWWLPLYRESDFVHGLFTYNVINMSLFYSSQFAVIYND